MPGSLLFTDKDDINNLDTSNPTHPLIEHTEQVENEEQINNWYELIVTGNDVCYYYLFRQKNSSNISSHF
jgi:hypothetical protein